MLGSNNDNTIKDLLKQVITQNNKLNKGVSQVVIEDAWAKTMGDVISSYTSKLYFSKGKLTVYLTSAPLRSEMSMSRNKVIDLLNEECGEGYVKEIVLK